MARSFLVASAFVVGAGAVGLQPAAARVAETPPPVTPTTSGQEAGATPAEYVIGPEDVVEVEVVGQPDKARAKVYADGTIQMNLIGKIAAGGKTPRELGADIAAALRSGGFYSNPAINVEVVNYASRYVTVLGAVASPGLVPMNRQYRLSEILARVGGSQASAAEYLIVRPETGGEQRYLIKDLAAGDPSKDPLVAPGDKVYAPMAEQFYVSGQVNSPGTFAIRADLTVRQALAMAGGLTASGSDKKVTVEREGKKVKLGGDDRVQPGDVLVVGERLF